MQKPEFIELFINKHIILDALFHFLFLSYIDDEYFFLHAQPDNHFFMHKSRTGYISMPML